MTSGKGELPKLGAAQQETFDFVFALLNVRTRRQYIEVQIDAYRACHPCKETPGGRWPEAWQLAAYIMAPARSADDCPIERRQLRRYIANYRKRLATQDVVRAVKTGELNI